MKSFIVFLGIVAVTGLLAGCGVADQTVTQWTGSAERCYKGVLYVNFTTGTSPVYRIGPNGEPLLTPC
jgi:hypothetical protein